ncbi:MAG: AcrB/AcrD/AcrF family protein [Bacteroidetes bacterium]|jgi:multidrug efflux pump subunit AcrB|nr:AcrB/AcrD/AcrF family protein [Bacteroidota bacterium]
MSAKELNEKVIRNFRITTLALKNRNTVYVLLLAILVFGLYTYRNLPKELFPEIVWPQIMVQTTYPGNSPEDIENLITRPLEKEIDGVKGLKEISSISAPDASMIIVEFNTDVDLEDALRRVKDAVERGESELPQDDNIIGPTAFDIDLSEFPILNINLSGEYSVEELKDHAEYLEEELEEIGEVSKVLIEGVNEREVKVNLDLIRMEALNLTFQQVSGAIANENVSMSAGEIKLGEARRTVRIVGEFENMKQLENIIVKSEEGKNVYLKDVGEVIYGYEEPGSFARLDKNPVVSVQVVKKSGENLLSATEKILNTLDQAKEDQMIPSDLSITLTNDQSEMVKMQLNNLENSMIMGIILVIMVLFFFLGMRNAVLVGFAIPMSMFLSFVIIGIIDFRINMIVLFALILALGMLVDNAIVVVENIYRFVDEGYKPQEAARQAVGEIAMPIIASTLTTLAAFFPLALWTGVMGEFMKYLPITLIIVLSSSLFIALVIIPVIASVFIKPGQSNKDENGKPKKRGLKIAIGMTVFGVLMIIVSATAFGNLLVIFGILGLAYHLFLYRTESWFQDIFLVKLENVYLKTLKFALFNGRPWLFFGGTILLLFFTIAFYFGSQPKVLLFPEGDPNYINVVVELPTGTDITATNAFTREMEDDIIEFLEPYDKAVESILTTVGKGNPDEISSEAKPNQAIITISFVDYEDRGDVNSAIVMRKLTEEFVDRYPGVTMEVSKDEGGPPAGKPINIEITGPEFNQLVHLADTMQTVIDQAGIKGIEGLQLNISTAKPELTVNIDRDKARRYGLSTQEIAQTIRFALFGLEASEYTIGEDEYPINVRLKDRYRYNISALQNIKIQTFNKDGDPVNIPVTAVADFEYTTTFSSVRRIDLDRAITIYSNVIEGYNPTEVNNQIKEVLDGFEMPAGYDYQFTGEQEEQAESMAFLVNAFMIAFALILVILVTQFNSVIRPIIIISSVVFSTIGVFGGLATFQMEFIIIMTGIGIISLAGIVVNNAIVLIDYIELLKQRKRVELGYEEKAFLPLEIATECIISGGRTRLRPVLLTAITTILGLLPMAVGLNIDFAGLLTEYKPNIYFGGDMAAMWSPMSWTVIFGLTFATFLTLVIVPVMYRITTIIQKAILKATNSLPDGHDDK